MKIAILGPGALGCLLAASLVEAGAEVFLADYRPERVALLRRQGIRLKNLDGVLKSLTVSIALAAEVGASDLAILTVKAHQTRAAARSLPLLLAPGGIALTLQNGLGNLEEMAAAVGPERLLAGVTFLGVTREGEGQVIYAGRGSVVIGAPPGSQVFRAEIDRVVTLFRRAGLECQAHDEIQLLLWEKLLINVGINPLTALLRVPNGALLKMPEAWELAVAAAAETLAVAQAAGLQLTCHPETRLRQVVTATAANRSSMLQDILAGRPTEIEALNAQVVNRGAALGVPTPINHCLTQLLRGLEQSAGLRVE